MNSNESLLLSLKELYAKLRLESLRQRIQNYFLNTSSHSQFDISSTLHQLIDDLVKDVSHQSDEYPADFNLTSDRQETIRYSEAGNSTGIDGTKSIEETGDGLSLYFKNVKAHEKDPSTAAMLRRRIWDHVHSTRRLASMGDKHSAVIHAEIVSSGFQTLAHYMTPDEHQAFQDEIVDHLSQKPDVDETELPIEKSHGL